MKQADTSDKRFLEGLAEYAKWLRDKGYQATTIKATLRHMRAVAADPSCINQYGPSVRRYLLYVRRTQRQPFGKGFTRDLKAAGYKAIVEIHKQGSRKKELLNSRQWEHLRAKLWKKPDTTNVLLVAYMESPHRINAFLTMRVDEITDADITDPAAMRLLMNTEQPLLDLKSWQSGRVYSLLCSTGRCTYSRMRKRLRDTHPSLDMDTLYKSYHALKEST